MDSSQQFNLRWNNYLSHISSAFDSLRSREEFVDVTLSCEGKKIKAHRMLLSACSNYFREIFKDNACPHPVIVFQNIKYEDLSGLITFMYQGQVNVDQESLQSFLNTAELLEVQGLTTMASKNKIDDECESLSDMSVSGGQGTEVVSDGPPQTKRRRVKAVKEEPLGEEPPTAEAVVTTDDDDDHRPASEDNSLNNHSHSPGDNEQAPEAISAAPAPHDSLNDSGTGSGNDFHDSFQGIFAQGLWRRLDPSLKQFNCDDCGKVFKHPRSLDHHKKMHEGRTTCPVCRRVFGRMYALRLHMTASHPSFDLATVIH